MHSTRMIERKVWIHHILENRPRQNSECGKELHKFFPPTEKTTFVFTSVLCILLLWLHIYTHYTIFTILVNFITGPFKRITVEACLQEEEDWTCTPSTWPASLSSSSSSLSPASASPSPTGTGGASAHSTWQKSGAMFRGKKIGHSTRCSNLFKDPHSKILLFTVIFLLCSGPQKSVTVTWKRETKNVLSVRQGRRFSLFFLKLKMKITQFFALLNRLKTKKVVCTLPQQKINK